MYRISRKKYFHQETARHTISGCRIEHISNTTRFFKPKVILEKPKVYLPTKRTRFILFFYRATGSSYRDYSLPRFRDAFIPLDFPQSSVWFFSADSPRVREGDRR